MMWYQQSQHQQSQTAPLSTVVPQFLDNNQQLVAHFNQQTGSGPFVEGLNVTDASQFVSVIQQQQNPHLQDGFNPATFFQQHHSQSVTQHHHPTAHQHHPTSHQTHSHHHHHNQQHQPQQLTCANVISANATSSIDGLSLAGAGHVIIDPTTNGLLGLGNRASVVGDRTALVMSTINNLRQHQQPRANIASDSNINCNSNGNSNNHRDHATLDECNLSVSKLAANNNNTHNSSGNHNNINNNNNNGNINSNNHANSNQKSSNSKSKNNCSNKKDKLDNHRSSESPRRIFSCPTCCKGFTEKFNMKRHMQIHSQSRPKYICNECSKSFAWKDNFIRHKKAAHGTSPAQYPV